MNQVLDGPSHAPSSQGRQGLGLEFTNQRSVSSVLIGPSEHDLRPQEIADAGLKVGYCMFCLPASLFNESLRTASCLSHLLAMHA